MIYSYQWLKEYVGFDLSPERLMSLLTSAGFPIEDFSSVGDDIIFECEIPANRGDLLSILGLAREVAAILGKKPPEFPQVLTGKSHPFRIKVTSLAPSLCPFYSARIIKGIKVESSPVWLKERLLKAKIRPINNIVDITNFVLLETGQPLHAFDLEKIEEEIIIRSASPGEKIKTLDGEMRTLNESMLLITDKKKPLAIAGIMGGEESQVTEATHNVLLESAYFTPFSIRKTAKSLNLSTEASCRFERRVNPAGVISALNRATYLIENGSKGEIATSSAYRADFLAMTSNLKLKLRKKRVMDLLGIEISSEVIKKILESLSFKVSEKENLFEVEVPSFRQDIKQEVDLIEEIVRLYGYEKIPTKIPLAKIVPFSENKKEKIASLLRETLISFGLTEIITSNFSAEGIKILNPLTAEQGALRTNLFSSLLSVFSRNLNQGNREMAFFELGKTYLKEKLSFREDLMLSIGIYNSGDFFSLKGILERVLERLGILDYSVRSFNHDLLEEEITAGIFVDNEFLGCFGGVKEKILSLRELTGQVYLGELNFELLVKFSSNEREFKPLAKYPGIRRDLAIVVDDKIAWKDITTLIKTLSPLIKKVKLFDIYQGKEIPSGYRSLAFSILYQSAHKTLVKNEVDELQEEVEKRLRERYRIEVRGK